MLLSLGLCRVLDAGQMGSSPSADPDLVGRGGRSSLPWLMRLPFDLSPSVLNAFKYPLLIGVGLSTVIGLLSCLIGYCSSHWCCKKEVQETRRERRRLMSMEMD